jgi:signal transduction histidine kinase
MRTIEKADSLDIVFEDDGLGIPDKESEQIFRQENYKNTGFGLFHSRKILAIMNLTIKETGTFDKGARFVIRLSWEHFHSLADPGANDPVQSGSPS